MKRNRFMLMAALWLMAAICIPVVMTAGKKPEHTAAWRQLKSLYYTRQAYNYWDSIAAAYELSRHALALDSANVNAGYNVAIWDWMVHSDTAINLLRKYGDRYAAAYPDDIDELTFYAVLLKNLGDDNQRAASIYESLLKRFPKRTDLFMDLAEAYRDNGDLEEAIEAVRRYERLEGMSPNSVYTKVNMLIAMEDTAGAERAIDTLVMEHPQDPDSWILRGGFFNVIENKDSARESLERAEALAPYKFGPKMYLADFYNQQGDTVRADAKMVEALSTNDRTMEEKVDGLTDFIQGLMYNNNDIRRAQPMIEALLAQEPDNMSVLGVKSALFETLKDYPRLIELLTQMVATVPDNSYLWGKLMLAHINQGDYGIVERIYNEAQQKISEPDPVLDLYLASAYSIDKKPEKAASAILKSITGVLPGYDEHMPPSALLDSVRSHNLRQDAMANMLQMLGDQYVSLNDTARGLGIYDQALELDPDNYMTLNNYAYFLALGGKDLDKALRMSERTVNAQPDNGTYLDTYAYILFRKHDYDRALMYQEMAIKATPEEEATPDLYEHYGDILFMTGNQAKALENWKIALEKDPGSDILKRKVQHETYFYK